ncbi:CHASE3 domain-containing protein [Mycobacterium ulcerans]|uniref:sensor histidine kinase n=1 Tax=Mycobacterium ulcerans TaxID=1809 RepID=UPI0012DDA6DB|nr:sensor histidine kinase [Mycobacterium ulcerans]MEB3968367.1 CHASE3 domain-containing protein [Mycobacterium ulcerans]MEB3976500.1 CHASE3 domain-containing protein [Mycobacterium ulcerans]MEB4005845.1 CHASE3 domain-containing protein [Mycobacterium ulcerans]MEB4415350.1 CHASE3 domain-containing protein [Mycobacterium ulcerans]MEB4433577.1 CHASE3 domain-containing protein [Mycobacterium ulcerans]
MTPEPPIRPRTRRRVALTVRGWQALVLSIMGVMVLAGTVAGAVLLNRTDGVSRELSDNIEPARVAAFQLQSALRDQESGIRGYVISSDSQFLSPYYDGRRTEEAAAQNIRRLLGRRGDLLADLDAIEKAARAWRASYAEPLIAQVNSNAPVMLNGAATAIGKAQFDQLRTLFEDQNRHLGAARAQAAERLQRMDDWRDRVLAAMVLLFFARAALLGVLTRRAVTIPLAALAAACRRFTEGNFGERIVAPRRPRDIRGIAIDVENMRQRMVEELDTSRCARAQLDEQAEELRRSNAELEQFAYVASHDLQEPLRKVAAFCQLLERRYADQLDERGIEYIGFAVDGAKRMQVLINDLLSFSRVGRLGATSVEVELGATLDAAVANLGAAIEESDAEIVRLEHGFPPVVGDPTLLTMLWQNLIGNAVKFRREDLPPRVVIDCQLGSGDHQGLWLLSVSDNGIGIAQEFADKVFIIFRRLHGRDSYGGTGLGLALCRKIVEHHGGTVWIDSSYTDGTRFQFTLPVAAPATADPEHLEPAEGIAE